MKKINPGVIIASVCVVAFVAGIGTGYLKSRKTNENNVNTEYIQSVIKEEESVIETVNQVEYYTVMSEDEHVFLYEVFSDRSTNELQRMDIAELYLPEEEKQILKEGIVFYEKEEALMVMESFIS